MYLYNENLYSIKLDIYILNYITMLVYVYIGVQGVYEPHLKALPPLLLTHCLTH